MGPTYRARSQFANWPHVVRYNPSARENATQELAELSLFTVPIHNASTLPSQWISLRGCFSVHIDFVSVLIVGAKSIPNDLIVKRIGFEFVFGKDIRLVGDFANVEFFGHGQNFLENERTMEAVLVR